MRGSTRLGCEASWRGVRRMGLATANIAALTGAVLMLADGDTTRAREVLAGVERYLDAIDREELGELPQTAPRAAEEERAIGL